MPLQKHTARQSCFLAHLSCRPHSRNLVSLGEKGRQLTKGVNFPLPASGSGSQVTYLLKKMVMLTYSHNFTFIINYRTVVIQNGLEEILQPPELCPCHGLCVPHQLRCFRVPSMGLGNSRGGTSSVSLDSSASTSSL